MAGAIAYHSRDTDGVLWNKVLEAGLGPIDFRTRENLGNKDDVEVVLGIRSRATGEGMDEAQGMANARQPRHSLGIGFRRRFERWIWKQVQHCSGLTGAGLTKN